MKRVVSNIQNLAFTILNAKKEDTKGRALKQCGIELNQAIVNGQSQGVGIRTINGSTKSAQIQLDMEAIKDLHAAVTEVLNAGK